MIDQLAGITAKPVRADRFAMSVEERAGLELNDRGNARRLLAAQRHGRARWMGPRHRYRYQGV